ncbi:MAG: N-methyl-L-tryptophan oxidase [Rhizomicrobium sp.]|jgi:sarcosine oxidase
MRDFDTIVVGLGAMGSASVYQLAKAGNRVLGLDRFSPPHNRGSSHGDTRITRLAVGEGRHLTPFVRRSHEIWRGIERETGERLLTVTGGLIVSSHLATAHTHVPQFFQNTLAAARTYGIPHEMLDAAQIRKRFPQFRVENADAAYYEPDAGFLRVDPCIRSQLHLAREFGAEIVEREKVVGVVQSDNGAVVQTDRTNYRARHIILCVGAWTPDFVDKNTAHLFRIFRQALHWFELDGPVADFEPGCFPVFIWELQNAGKVIYGFPAVDGVRGGIKIATERYDATTNADSTASDPDDAAQMHHALIAANLPGVGARCLRTETCLYTVTPDAGFVIDRHPGMENVIFVSACSGHGFKHSAAIGEALAQWVVDGGSALDLSPFGLARFHS